MSNFLSQDRDYEPITTQEQVSGAFEKRPVNRKKVILQYVAVITVVVLLILAFILIIIFLTREHEQEEEAVNTGACGTYGPYYYFNDGITNQTILQYGAVFGDSSEQGSLFLFSSLYGCFPSQVEVQYSDNRSSDKYEFIYSKSASLVTGTILNGLTYSSATYNITSQDPFPHLVSFANSGIDNVVNSFRLRYNNKKLYEMDDYQPDKETSRVYYDPLHPKQASLIVTNTSNTTFTYANNSQGLITQITAQSNHGLNVKLNVTYNNASQITDVNYFFGALKGTFDYSYDAKGRFTMISGSTGQSVTLFVARFTYDENSGNLTTLWSNFTQAVSQTLKFTYT